MDCLERENHEKAKVYNSQIKDLVLQIRRICNQAQIPYFFAFGVKMDENGNYPVPGGMICSALLPEIIGIQSNDPKFARMVNVINGFATTAEDRMIMDVDDLPSPAKLNADHSIEFSSLEGEG